MSAHCHDCGTDLVYVLGEYPLMECPVCVRDVELCAARGALANADDLLRRLGEWDHLPLLADGPFWLGEIAKTRAAIAALTVSSAGLVVGVTDDE